MHDSKQMQLAASRQNRCEMIARSFMDRASRATRSSRQGEEHVREITAPCCGEIQIGPFFPTSEMLILNNSNHRLPRTYIKAGVSEDAVEGTINHSYSVKVTSLQCSSPQPSPSSSSPSSHPPSLSNVLRTDLSGYAADISSRSSQMCRSLKAVAT